jgi:hypothetical protein
MAGKTKTTRNFSKYKPLVIILAVLVAILLVSILFGYLLSKNGYNTFLNKENEQVELVNGTKPESIKTVIEGTWVSNYDGAILGINGLTFGLDLPSVDAPKTIKGILSVEQSLVTFTDTSGNSNCQDLEGHYKFRIEDDEISFELIKDPCESRKERMTMSWFRL